MSAAEELDKLKKMLDDGTITDEQYERARASVLEKQSAEHVGNASERRPRRRDDEYEEDDRHPSRQRQKETRMWCMVLHLSLFAGHIVPFGGIIAPIVIWQTQKGSMPEIDAHGKNAANWIISSIIYALICIPLCFILIGFALLFVLVVLNVVFPIIAAIKANQGEVWKYPLTITFFK